MGGKRRWRKRGHSGTTMDRHEHTDPQVTHQVDLCFEKKFHYQKDDQVLWELPPSACLWTSDHWQEDSMQQLKTKLNEVKNSLSNLDITQWHKHTQQTHKAGGVISFVRHNMQPELCTQAWCKFHELVASLPLVSLDKPHLNTVHICEAPGAFITSLNHYLRCRDYKGAWTWRGNTLNPYYEGNSLSEMIDDDRFILDTLPNWYFGPDNTGNIMNRENLDGLKAHTDSMAPIHLVTADGSIDCQNNPAQQESSVASLHYCEVVASLYILSPGGSMVLKMFTLFEDTSVSLMYLLNCAFEQVYVVKPATSKSGNSEVYVVCLNYQGTESDLLEVLLQHTGMRASSEMKTVLLDRNSIPESFMTQHIVCCRQFTNYQIETIQHNLATFQAMYPQDQELLLTVRHHCCLAYADRFQVKPISNGDRIVPKINSMGRKMMKFDTTQRRHVGSYNERAQQSQLPWQQRVLQMEKYKLVEMDELTWIQNPFGISEADVRAWNPVFGQPLSSLRVSRLCSTELLDIFNDILEHRQASLPCEADRADRTLLEQLVLAVCRDSVGTDGGIGKVLDISGHGDWFVTFAEDKIEEQQNERGSKRLIYGDITEGHHQFKYHEEIHIRKAFLKQVIQMLQIAQPGDHFVCQSSTLLTRVSAGVLYLLQRVFTKITVSRGRQESGTMFVACSCCRRICPALLQYLQMLETPSDSQAKQELLQVVPMQLLCDASFQGYLQDINNTFLQQQINFLLQLEKQHFASQMEQIQHGDSAV